MFTITRLSFAILIAGVAALMICAGCNTSSGDSTTPTSIGSDCTGGKTLPFRDDLTVAQSESLITTNEGRDCFAIIDVRTSTEYDAGHIPDAVKYDIYTDEFDAALTTLDKDTVYLVYCRSGNRSATAADRMRDAGFKAVFNMLGGFNDWTAAEYPSEM